MMTPTTDRSDAGGPPPIAITWFDRASSSARSIRYPTGCPGNGILVLSGGTLDVLSGGTASGTIDSGGLDVVLGAANGTMIDSGGTEVLTDGGTACGMIVNSGGIDAWSAAGLRVAPRWTALA
jgi:autotransporter passenger strand-loop-strand repeat protein